MHCENKNNLLDIYYNEGNEHKCSQTREHAANCKECMAYLSTLERTMSMLDKLEEKEPPEYLFNNILSDISGSTSAAVVRKSGISAIPILQILLGQMLLLALVYLCKILVPFKVLGEISNNSWLLQSLGSTGISVILVMAAGSFVTLALAPVLFLESKKNSKI